MRYIHGEKVERRFFSAGFHALFRLIAGEQMVEVAMREMGVLKYLGVSWFLFESPFGCLLYFPFFVVWFFFVQVVLGLYFSLIFYNTTWTLELILIPDIHFNLTSHSFRRNNNKDL